MEKGKLKVKDLMRFSVLAALLAVALMACREVKKHSSERSAARHADSPRKEHAAVLKDTTKAVAVFRRNENDERDNNDFKVAVFPTQRPSVFRLDIRYGMNHAADHITLPPAEFFTAVALQPGEDDDHCILGFKDKGGKFNEMVEISGTPSSIGIKTLRKYYIR